MFHASIRPVLATLLVLGTAALQGQQPPRGKQDHLPPRITQKPPLHGRHWMAVTIWLDRAHATLWGAASNHGEDHGIAW